MDKYVLAQMIAQSADPGWVLRQGEAVSVQDDYTATVKVAGSDTEVTGVRYMGDPPKPASGVWVMANSNDLFILGSIASAGRAAAPLVYRTTNVSISNATPTPITWEAEDADAYGFWSSGSAVTVNVPGRYVAVGQTDFASNATGVRSASIVVDGAVVGAQRVAAYSGVAHVNVSSVPFTVGATATVALWVEQNSSGALDVVASGSLSPGLGIYYLGA